MTTRFQPQVKQVYWCLQVSSVEASVQQRCWLESSGDVYRYKMGNCFRTEREAKIKLKEMLNILAAREDKI